MNTRQASTVTGTMCGSGGRECTGAPSIPPPTPLSTPLAWAPAPALLRPVLCVVNNSPARWRGVVGNPFKPIAHAVGPLQGFGQEAWELAQTTHTSCPCPVASASSNS